ncbi:MAG: VWA domain-containing protein [Phycisphaerales bacterium]|nr:VWA domain-containing protein [Phycisphaerales bacterium]
MLHSNTRFMKPTSRIGIWCILASLAAFCAAPAAAQEIPGGELRIASGDGKGQACPLKHTDVVADVSGFFARVHVRQVFHNPTKEKIEAIYVFPLPQHAAVDDMVMTIGDRRVVGQIRKREEAKAIYEQAKAAGHVASLLDQERPNIFTQSVANIEPGVEVAIEISYVETLKYEDGQFEFMFPMVVGPRYIPGGGSAPAPLTTGQPTPQVPDAHKITPPVTPKGTRAGHDISLKVRIDAGMAIQDIASVLHDVDVTPDGTTGALVALKNRDEIPNRDFILHYRLATDQIAHGLLTHVDERGTFLTILLQPPKRVLQTMVVPRELVFVLDTSGSMSGFPIEKSKETMSKLIDGMGPLDTFNLITFAGDTNILWDEPRPATPENRKAAQEFLASRKGGGGTEMMKAIDAALRVPTPTFQSQWDQFIGPDAGGKVGQRDLLRSRMHFTARGMLRRTRPEGCKAVSADAQYAEAFLVSADGTRAFAVKFPPNVRMALPGDGAAVELTGECYATEAGVYVEAKSISITPIRVVCFMTDGYVGNDMAIIDAVKKNADTTRVFSFGAGNGVNRFLLDGMAHAGRGEVEYVTLASQGDEAARKFHERLQSPVLTDISIDWGGLPVDEVYPERIDDLFSSKPIVVHARLSGPVTPATITLRGLTGEGPYESQIALEATGRQEKNPSIASLWAREKVESLMNRDLAAAQQGNPPEGIKETIIGVGLTYRLLTQFTSFVAVEELTITSGGQPKTIQVPVEMPDGVSYEGVFGDSMSLGFAGGRLMARGAYPAAAAPTGKPMGGVGGEAKKGETAAVRLIRRDEARDAATEVAEAATQPLPTAAKIAASLTGLAAKVETDGKDGTLTVGKIAVTEYRLSVMIQMADLSEETLGKLKALGVQIDGQSKLVNLVIATVDVRKLEEIAKLDAVLSIKPTDE